MGGVGRFERSACGRLLLSGVSSGRCDSRTAWPGYRQDRNQGESLDQFVSDALDRSIKIHLEKGGFTSDI